MIESYDYIRIKSIFARNETGKQLRNEIIWKANDNVENKE